MSFVRKYLLIRDFEIESFEILFISNGILRVDGINIVRFLGLDCIFDSIAGLALNICHFDKLL